MARTSWATLHGLAALAAAVVAVEEARAAESQSLYDATTFRSLIADQKALRAGDVLTVQVVENATGTANADTGSRRSHGVAATLVHARSPSVRVGLDASGEFDGGGRTTRTARLVAQLSVTVRDVLPNGDLLVQGEQLLAINDEQQRIQLQGRARPQDVSEGNVVLSTRLADLRITYVGEGELADRQRVPWWRRAFDWVGF
jgi:flagellar L-ring protein FlgH